ncbi:hypothetical protein [Nitrosomonas sp. Nm58]|uniref:hypothetical protein n=1 Tax=Nitrosomonas sp. Nm58 TaxID=200126 RepID=UPI000896366D|nr:hypothetical protein [Nitrosomonas sp. Nm58]SDY21978.1 hypothetical protein SAMN05421754_10044 [Nitrosomonas sp. Nm58]
MLWVTGYVVLVLERGWRVFPAIQPVDRCHADSANWHHCPYAGWGCFTNYRREESGALYLQRGAGLYPMIGHLDEASVVIHDEFREGNIAPASRNLEFIEDCETHLPKGYRIAHVRLNSAVIRQTSSTAVK